MPELNAERDSSNTLVRNTLHLAEKLEGLYVRLACMPAASSSPKDDLENYIPISTNKGCGPVRCAIRRPFRRDVGLLKMDFLGLKTLSIIKDAIDNIELARGIKVDIDKVPLDDAETFALYSRGDTTGLFQFASPRA